MRLGRPQHSLSSQIVFPAAIHLSFYKLEPIHMPLGGTIAERECQTSAHRIQVVAQARGKPAQRGDPALLGVVDLGVKVLTPSLPHQRHERACAGDSRRDGCIGRTRGRDERGVMRS